MADVPESLAFYTAPGRFTALDVDLVPSGEVGAVVDVVQGLLIYDLTSPRLSPPI